MTALESPLEALAFNYLSFGFLTSVNTVWTLVAVITTAAVSVWRIRASSPPGQPSNLTWYPSSEPTLPSSIPTVPSTAEKPVTASAVESALITSPVVRTSKKLALYYLKYEDAAVNSNDDDNVEVLHWVGDSWKIRMGDMDWYRYQDLKVLDGSVVRLWDGCGRRKAAIPLAECDNQGHIMWCRCQSQHSNLSQFYI